MHIPVLQKEVIEYLDPKPNENFIDCTIGEGGHTLAILEKTSPDGKVMGIDQDQEQIENCKSKKIISSSPSLLQAEARKLKIENFKNGSVLIALPVLEKNIILAARNLPKVQTIQAKDLNALDLLSFKYLILPKESLKIIKETFLK